MIKKFYTIKDAFEEKDFIIEEIKKGKVFVYPTDTVYGIGCNAEIKECVERIYSIKQRERDKPLSIIAPSITWITEHFEVDLSTLNLYLPGPYTLLIKTKKHDFLEHIAKNKKIGVRIPEHAFTYFISLANIPFITTSANLSGEESPKSLEEVNEQIINKADYIIEGECQHKRPSAIVDLDSNEVKERSR